MRSKENRLAQNTAMLFLLTFSNYLFNFITIPYQTRVLAPEVMGNINFAASVMTYFQLFLDFGFLLSATEEIAKNREDPKKISRIFSAVTFCKLGLVLLSFAILGIVCTFIPRFRGDVPLFFLYLTAYSLFAFLPDYLYRGIEEMRAITVRSVAIKLFSTLMIFIFLRAPSQYYAIPILTGIGNLGAVVGALLHLYSKGYRLVRVPFSEIWRTMKRSAFFFLSRIASTVFTATNTFLLGMIYGEGAALVGLYSTAEKGITVAKQAVTPITDSLYPYMIRHRDFKMVKKILWIGMPILFLGCGGVMLFAEPLCAFLFGAEYRAAGVYLRLLAPIVFFSLPGTVFGFPVLTPMGLAKYANISTVFAAVLQISMLIGLALTIGITPARICVITCITEAAICLFRVGVFLRYRKK